MKSSFVLLLILILSAGISDAQTRPSRYENDLQRFRLEDSLSPPIDHNILFIGSSSFTIWKDVKDYFPGYPILNRAYGGSCLTDLENDFNRLILPYHPKQIVIYCGENDFATDTTLAPEIVVKRFIGVYHLLRNAYPSSKITYIAMKPSPLRWFLKDKYIAGNKAIRKFLKHQKNCSFVNIWELMLDSEGLPRAEIFLEDDLHMNVSGYHIWQKAIHNHLLK